MSASVSVVGRELIAEWTRIDRATAAWVLKLADFDASGAWREDGFASCASWLTTQCELSRSDAYEKLKVAHEMTRRYVVRVAFEEGLAYSKVRVLARLDGVDHERDEEFVEHAKSDSVRVLEERVKNWNYFNTQDKRPRNLDDHYGIHRQRGFGGGLGRLVIEAPDDMLDRMFALLDAYGEFLFHNGKASEVDAEPVDESTQWTHPQDTSTERVEPATEPRSSSAKRLDYLFDLLEERALVEPKKLDPHRAAIGVTIQYEDLIAGTGHGLSSQDSTLTGEAVRRLCCDAGVVRVVVKGQSEILDVGREERLFNRTQRRAIRFRHGHVCAARGCGRRITQIHLIQWWEDDGETCIDNGVPLCSYHHHLVHEGGWTVAWDPSTGITRLEGPLGQILETEARFGRLAA